MDNSVKETLTGALVLAVLGIVFAFSYGGEKTSAVAASQTYQVEATFNRVDGLNEGGEVRLGGISVGNVTALNLDEHYRAVLTLGINTGVELSTDTAAAIHTDGLFGPKYITLEPGGDDEMLANGDQITYTQDAVIVSDLLDMIIAEGQANRTKDTTEKKNEGAVQ